MASKQSETNRVLAIGMVDSVHFARWLSSAQGVDAKFTIFPSGPNRRVHPMILGLTTKSSTNFSLSGFLAVLSLPIWILDLMFFGRVRAIFLFYLLRLKHYDVVHFHEMQAGGYPLTHLPTASLSKSRVFYTPYGSDLFWFQKDPKHLPRIRATLRLTDGIFPECERDGGLARNHGFQGELFSVMPASGTFQFDGPVAVSVLNRSKITVKGYGGTWGMAVEVLLALEKVQDRLQGYEIHLTSVTKDVAREVARLQSESTLNLVLYPKFSLTTEEIKTLLSQSRYYISLSKSDGFPASLYEALACGAIPIQSDTACLPDSLVNIYPSSFVSTEDWPVLGALLMQLDSDPKKLQILSKEFSKWAKKQEIKPELFRTIISKAYGLTSKQSNMTQWEIANESD
jgi:glycosyltransferase involved in cell wall biosynthesis